MLALAFLAIAAQAEHRQSVPMLLTVTRSPA
jgi:hypothetical protein